MRIVDSNGNTLSTYDLEAGYLIDTHIIKESALPIDNISKFAWADDDYEAVKMYIKRNERESNQTEPDVWSQMAEAIRNGVNSV